MGWLKSPAREIASPVLSALNCICHCSKQTSRSLFNSSAVVTSKSSEKNPVQVLPSRKESEGEVAEAQVASAYEDFL